MSNERRALPFRRNCEGYIFDDHGNVLARKEAYGIVFPGGGFKEHETPTEAMKRETLEETNVVLENVREIHRERFVWNPDWPKTQKQQERFKKFQGDEMHFFVGKAQRPAAGRTSEPHASGSIPFLPVDEVLKKLRLRVENDPSEYVRCQLKLLQEVQDETI